MNHEERRSLYHGEPQKRRHLTGSTATLVQRVYQHREMLIEGFTKSHGCTLLVWFEVHEDLQEARRREWQIKRWKRSWKVRMIEEANPDWRDLWFEIQG
ncbi:MAG: GIY-YIG nuclease family protein [Sphingopyxis sp.]